MATTIEGRAKAIIGGNGMRIGGIDLGLCKRRLSGASCVQQCDNSQRFSVGYETDDINRGLRSNTRNGITPSLQSKGGRIKTLNHCLQS